ncbi:MAG: polyprenyl synthetase family protein [Gammaproteobacteria bacterium]
MITDIALQSDNRLNFIRQGVETDFEAVNALILANLHSEVPLIPTIVRHIIDSGGKRLRPLLTLLCAKALGYQGKDHIQLAAIIEFIHTATLLHDDVVDESSLRRGKPTANTVWGGKASILVGDFLYSRTFQLIIQLKNLSVMQILADATNKIAEGEVLQLAEKNNPDITEAHYYKVIQCKTAMLFAAAAEISAAVTVCSEEQRQALSNYGLHLGMAFQMIDDWLDYMAPAADTGKNLGDDLTEGKVTLPLIYAMQHGTSAQADLIRQAILQGGLTDFKEILAIVKATGGFDYIRKQAQYQVNLAQAQLACLPESSYKTALWELALLAIDRKA